MAERPAWPSLQEQLAAAKPPSGSALERLIRDNQDFHLLQPDEAHDNVPLPLWLRVFWRKGHPIANPGAGYPDVLYTIYAQMLAHSDTPWGSPPGPTRARGGRR